MYCRYNTHITHTRNDTFVLIAVEYYQIYEIHMHTIHKQKRNQSETENIFSKQTIVDSSTIDVDAAALDCISGYGEEAARRSGNAQPKRHKNRNDRITKTKER